MDDKEIVQLYFERSERAIAETNIKYEKYCYRIAYNILYNREDAQECVNDTYLRVWRSIPPFRPQCFSAYLGKITRNLALNLYEKLHRKKRGGGQLDVVYEELKEVLSTGDSPETKIELDFLTECINNYLSTLSQMNRMAFVGRYWYMDSIKAISDHLGISQSKTKSILFRARNGLKEYLKKEGIIV